MTIQKMYQKSVSVLLQLHKMNYRRLLRKRQVISALINISIVNHGDYLAILSSLVAHLAKYIALALKLCGLKMGYFFLGF